MLKGQRQSPDEGHYFEACLVARRMWASGGTGLMPGRWPPEDGDGDAPGISLAYAERSGIVTIARQRKGRIARVGPAGDPGEGGMGDRSHRARYSGGATRRIIASEGG